jgi:DNA-binding transcriptional ArsR family regulator
MRAKQEYRDRDEAEVAVLDALANRGSEGMTVYELRSHADVDIDRIETALSNLKADGLIEVTDEGQRTVIVPDEDVITSGEPDDEQSFIDDIRDRLPF